MPEFNSEAAVAAARTALDAWADEYPEAAKALSAMAAAMVKTPKTQIVGWKVFGRTLIEVA